MEHTNELCIILEHGLGNQLFNLFAGISKAIDENRNFIIYPVYNTFRKFFFTSLLKSLVFKITGRINISSKDQMYEEPFFHYNPIPDNKKAIKGYFQSHKYFNHNKNKIIDILQLQPYMDKYKFDDTEKIVAIHIRLGDYTFNKGNHHMTTPIYFINAIRYLITKDKEIETYKFIIFGEMNDSDLIDDYISEFKENFPNINFSKFWDINKNNKDYQELMYMSSCSHIIISSSTYSWFAAYLNDNNNKIIIYPNKWFGCNNIHLKTDDLFPSNWICIKDEE